MVLMGGGEGGGKMDDDGGGGRESREALYGGSGLWVVDCGLWITGKKVKEKMKSRRGS